MHKVGRILECPLELISTHKCRKCILRIAFTGTPFPLSPHPPPACPTPPPPPPCLSSPAPPHHPPSRLAWGWHPDQVLLPRRDREVQGGRLPPLLSVQQVLRRPGAHAQEGGRGGGEKEGVHVAWEGTILNKTAFTTCGGAGRCETVWSSVQPLTWAAPGREILAKYW